jgi:threonine/homoserine/homoserine lactone efflux protein
MALIIARSAQQGIRAGIAAALGIAAGLFVHIIAAAIGLSAIIVASAAAFTVLKWIGALYLIYLGMRIMHSSLRGIPCRESLVSHPTVPPRQTFMQGFLTNVLNPKIALFFLAFLPQFVDGYAPSKAEAFITLGLVFNAVGTTWNIVVACCAGALVGSTGYLRLCVWLERALGALFLAVGVKLALAERP